MDALGFVVYILTSQQYYTISCVVYELYNVYFTHVSNFVLYMSCILLLHVLKIPYNNTFLETVVYLQRDLNTKEKTLMYLLM